ncbi:hypothetical protein [Vreelandella titanicae]|uniref:hypothetical protein n=1 Tax=Vreelandella titanicae TaxID=664683 RepID=UPI0011407C0B|nr:hypothetical protein [Halomonas titanicae]
MRCTAVVSANIQYTRYDPALPATTEVFAECVHRIKVPGASQRAAFGGSASRHGQGSASQRGRIASQRE